MELLKNLEGLSADEQMSAVVELQKAAMKHLEEQKQASIGKSAEMVILGLKKIKSDFEAKFDSLNYDIQTKVASLKDGEQGLQGPKGEQGDRGLDGSNGRDGRDGKDGKDGLDGVDGVGVRDAKIDFDGSLVISLTDGREINCGEVVSVDVAKQIQKVTHNIQTGSGGDSQTVLDSIAALQATIATYGTMATQNKTSVDIEGGTIDNTTIGATTPSTGVFTTLTSNSTAQFGRGVANYFQMNGGDGVTSSPTFSLQGSSSDITGLFVAKGTGVWRFLTGSTAEQARIAHTASAVNYHQLTGSATGSGPIHSVAGSDTNIDLNLTTKGTGAVKLNSGNGTGLEIADNGATTGWFRFFGGTTTTILENTGAQTNITSQYRTKGTGTHQFNTGGTFANTQFNVSHTASAVNYVQVTGAATSGAPVISVQGSDTNITVFYQTKGVGSHVFGTRGTTQQFRISDTGSAVNYFQANGSITGFGPVLSAQGSDTNIPAVVQPKGTGALQAQQTDSTATGGNARGANAVDWQTSRSTAAQVASGSTSFVGSGRSNTASGQDSFVGSGFQNSASAAQASVLNGANNQASSQYAFIGNGFSNTANIALSSVVNGSSNTASGYYGFIGSGASNTTTSSSVVTTQSATMNGTTAVTLSGSNGNIKVGQIVTGSFLGFPNYVAAVSGTSLTLSTAASGSGTSTLSFFTPHGVVVGGGNNQATGSYSFIGGGGDAGTAANRNVASGDWSVVGGGVKNVASGLYSAVGGGGFNTASGISSFIGGGGNNGAAFFTNTASGISSSVVGGVNNNASAFGAFIGGGFNHAVNSNSAGILNGQSGTTRSLLGFTAFPSHNTPISSTQGSSQGGLLILGVQTTNATATVLRSDTSAASTTNQVILPNNSAYYFRGEVVSGVTGGGNTKGWFIEGVIKRGANAASTALVGTPTVTSSYADAGASTWTIAVTADTTNGGLAVTFTGQASTTIRTVAQIRTTEMTY